ncbi:AraC family transcriptional regulator [Scatolibacter rhodanostii]|uniref:AraC family transcriptional regulator n=1 Tax=Scatolibacter rhodanostii TaxID=2014781 RepID=UPI000C087AAD|nr:AraC family transcriptional regulator [Scatolibacter rhodanostii]
MSIYSLSNRYAQIEAYYALQWQHFDMEVHVHARCEIMCVIRGSCKIFLGKDEILLREKQLIFIDQDIPHRLLVEGSGCQLLNLEFACLPYRSGMDLRLLMEKSPDFQDFLTEKRPYVLLHDTAHASTALNELIKELESGGMSFLSELLFYRLLIILSKCRENAPTGIRYIRLAKEYLQAHFEEDIRVQEVAEAVGLSSAYLHVLFTQHTGHSIIDAVHALRLEKACFLLQNTKQTITEIAFACGYNSRQQFGYAFSGKLGISPGQYRKKQDRIYPADTETFRVIYE